MRATKSARCRPYLATTGRRTSVTGLVGLAFRPTERLMGTKSSLEKEKSANECSLKQHIKSLMTASVPEESAFFESEVPRAQRQTVLV